MSLLKWQRHILEMAAYLGRYVNFRKATVNFIVSVCLSVCLSCRMGQLGSCWADFRFLKSYEKIHFRVNSNKTIDSIHKDLRTFMTISRRILLGIEKFRFTSV